MFYNIKKEGKKQKKREVTKDMKSFFEILKRSFKSYKWKISRYMTTTNVI